MENHHVKNVATNQLYFSILPLPTPPNPAPALGFVSPLFWNIFTSFSNLFVSFSFFFALYFEILSFRIKAPFIYFVTSFPFLFPLLGIVQALFCSFSPPFSPFTPSRITGTSKRIMDQFLGTAQLLNFADLNFGSAAGGLEYNMLDNMLQSPIPATPTPHDPGTAASMTFNKPDVLVKKYSPIPMPQTPPTHPATRKTSGPTRTPAAVYNEVRQPFNYAEGFHYLIRYVRERMGREDLMRISRALALFRPSFLALIMNLTEEDLVFMEKCLQRTLLEYEKLISFSGTPTVVWRRTGEICLVGKEFSLLTQWPRDVLMNKKTYIYELMDNGSTVEYWEKFSTHAFDSTDKSCTYSCILRTPTQKPVPCTFCFTIKRDIFDLPSVIVGNFLPLLS